MDSRSAYVCYQGCMSNESSFELGTPQRRVLSLTLFNVLMNNVAKKKIPKRCCVHHACRRYSFPGK